MDSNIMELLPLDKLGAGASKDNASDSNMKLLPLEKLRARDSKDNASDSNMKLLPLEKLGARASKDNPYVIDFGIFLPGISASNEYKLWVKIIHEHDQFLQDIPPQRFELIHTETDKDYGAYWTVKVDIVDIKKHEKLHKDSKWGEEGRYVYRYCLKAPNKSEEIDWIIDPFAREFGVGKLSSITVEYKNHEWSEHEKSEWKTPALNELVIYELMINEFGGDVDGTIERLDYLKDLGVNCIELMPVSNVANTVDWGYMPIGHFGVDERFGRRKDLQELIDEAHKRKIAVIVDVVYAHTDENFAYTYVYKKLGFEVKDNPFQGDFAKNGFGYPEQWTNFNKQFTRDFFFTVNHYWLERYHVDGFRYDYVPGYFDGPTGNGYANLTYSTYQTVKEKEQTLKEKQEGWEHWQRFFNNGTINLIQCAEQLEQPVESLEQSYSNCTWQNGTWEEAKNLAKGDKGRLTQLGRNLGLEGFPTEVTINGEKFPRTALQYIETHDHERFICNFGLVNPGNNNDELFKEGDREHNWYKVQPYLISILTAKGIPLLWQGQEFGENYYVPENASDLGRILLFRCLRWDYFYDEVGQNIIHLVRKLIKLRKQPQFTSLNDDTYYFHNNYARYQSKGVLIFTRKHDNAFSIVALNFGDSDQTVQFRFPEDKKFEFLKEFSGNYQEQLHGTDYPSLNLKGITRDGEHNLTIPSNYGRIWTLETNT